MGTTMSVLGKRGRTTDGAMDTTAVAEGTFSNVNEVKLLTFRWQSMVESGTQAPS